MKIMINTVGIVEVSAQQSIKLIDIADGLVNQLS
jgi:hypothetical protein